MLLRWHSGRRVVLARHAVGVSRPDGCDRGPAAHYADIDEALAALRALPVPRPTTRSGRSAGVWIDDAFTRMFGATWPAGITDIGTFRAFLAARFEQRFELPAEQWTIVSPGAWPGRPVLCVAAPTSLLTSLRETLAVHGLRVGRATPLSLVEVGVSIATRPRTTTLFIGSIGSSRAVFLFKGGRLADCAVLPDSPRIASLAEAVFRERGLIEGEVRRVLRVEIDRHGATEALMSDMPLPLQLLRPGGVEDTAPDRIAGVGS